LNESKEKYLVGESSLIRRNVVISKKSISKWIQENCQRIQEEDKENGGGEDGGILNVDSILLEYFGMKQTKQVVEQPIPKKETREHMNEVFILYNYIQHVFSKKLNVNEFYESIVKENEMYQKNLQEYFKKDFKSLNSLLERIHYLLNLMEESMVEKKDLFLENPRQEPLGYDRYLNRYWFFHSECLFLEMRGVWFYYDTLNEIDQLLNWLSDRNTRERSLKINLKRIYYEISEKLK
jgi:hypothetical protein